MTTAPVAALAAPRRVTVVTGRSRVDIALPAQCTVAELLPPLVWLTGAAAEPAPAGYFWTLRRLGAAPFPPAATVAAAGIRDGEVLHLMAGASMDPSAGAPVFDDVVDAIANSVQGRPGRWRAALSRQVGIGVVAGGLALAAALLAVVAPYAATGLAVAALVAGGALARAQDDPGVGAAVAAGGLPAALVAGAGLVTPGAGLTVVPAALAAGLAAATVYAVLAAVAIRAALAWFAAAALTAGTGAAVALTAQVTDVRLVWAVAVALPLVVAVSPLFPVLALRLARLPLPRVPADITAFRADEQPTPAGQVAAHAEAAETALTGLLTALAALVTVAGLVLLRTGDRWAWALAGLCVPALLLRSRAYARVGQRAAVLLGAGIVLLGTAARLAVAGGPQARLALVAAALLAGAVAAGYAHRVVGRTPSPYWSRLLDVLEFASLAALVPVALQVAGVYASVRGLAR